MSPRTVSVFYGSQTGCAESIAQRIYDEALEKQLDAELRPLNDFQKSKVEERDGHVVVIVCSTTGNGDPPDNCGRFWRYVKRRTQPKDMLAKLRYTVLGLGDTNYDKFCFMGKSINKRMSEIGAQSFYEFGAADEAMGLEDFVEPWLAGLWTAYDKATGAGAADTDVIAATDAADEVETSPEATTADASTVASAVPSTSDASYLLANLISYEKMFGPLDTPTEIPADLPRLQSSLLNVHFLDDNDAVSEATTSTEAPEDEEISSTNPYMASVVGAEYLTAAKAERKVLRLDISLGQSGITYVPGDSIGVKCPNRGEDVDALLACLGINSDTLFCAEPVAAKKARGPKRASTGASSTRFPSPCSVRDAFLLHSDILSSPKKAALRALAGYCTDEEQRAQLLVLSSKTGADKFKTFVTEQQLNFVELLHLFPSCKPPLDLLLTLLPQLMPRYYSIATSPLVDAKKLSVAFTVVEEDVGERGLRRRGLCTNWLSEICQPLLGDTETAAPNADVKIPIFLRGFLQHRQYESMHTMMPSTSPERGEAHLFFGCRRQTEDWLFREQMHEYLADGTLTQLFTAFSRDQEDKHYVQHDLRANGKLVCDLLLESSGYLFVCGDGMAMARDVHAALVDVLQTHAGLSEQQADGKLKELGAQQRYVRDIW